MKKAKILLAVIFPFTIATSCKQRTTSSAAKGVQSQAYNAPARKILVYQDHVQIKPSENLVNSLKPYVTKIPGWMWMLGHRAVASVYVDPQETPVIELFDRDVAPSDRQPFAVLTIGAEAKGMISLLAELERQSMSDPINVLLMKMGSVQPRQNLYSLKTSEIPGKEVGKLRLLSGTENGATYYDLTLDELCSGASKPNCDVCISPNGRIYKIVAANATCPAYPDDPEFVKAPPNVRNGAQ